MGDRSRLRPVFRRLRFRRAGGGRRREHGVGAARWRRHRRRGRALARRATRRPPVLPLAPPLRPPRAVHAEGAVQVALPGPALRRRGGLHRFARRHVPTGARRSRPPRRLTDRRHQRSRRGARRPRRGLPRLLRLRHHGPRSAHRQASRGGQGRTRRGSARQPRRPAPRSSTWRACRCRRTCTDAASHRSWPAGTPPGIGPSTRSRCPRCCTTAGPRSGRCAPTATSSSRRRAPSSTTWRRIPPRRRTSTPWIRTGPTTWPRSSAT